MMKARILFFAVLVAILGFGFAYFENYTNALLCWILVEIFYVQARLQ